MLISSQSLPSKWLSLQPRGLLAQMRLDSKAHLAKRLILDAITFFPISTVLLGS